MSAPLRRYADRLDALSLRERALIFVAAALVLIAVIHLGFIAPLMEKNRSLSREVAGKQSELTMLQAQLQSLARTNQMRPDEANRAKLKQSQGRLEQLDAQIGDATRRFTSPQHMRDVLEGILVRNPRLQLVDLKTLPVDLFGNSSAQGRPIYRHAIELTVSGGYLDLYAYLRELEGLSTQLYWGKANLAVAEYPRVVLKLTVYTLSFDRAWMNV
ncbi:MAG: type II secretion system protein GspM [Burkholderiales bacterium]